MAFVDESTRTVSNDGEEKCSQEPAYVPGVSSDERLETITRLSSLLKSVEFEKIGDLRESPIFVKPIEKKRLGFLSKAQIEDIPFAVKEDAFWVMEFSASIAEEMHEQEMESLKKARSLVEKQHTPHVVLMPDCKSAIGPHTTKIPQELFDGNLHQLFSDNPQIVTPELVDGLLFQWIQAMVAWQTVCGMSNEGISMYNVFYKKVPAGGYWRYEIAGENYYVPNNGIFAAIGDFGTTRSRQTFEHDTKCLLICIRSLKRFDGLKSSEILEDVLHGTWTPEELQFTTNVLKRLFGDKFRQPPANSFLIESFKV